MKTAPSPVAFSAWGSVRAGGADPWVQLFGILVMGDGSSCDCFQFAAKGKKEYEVYFSSSAAKEPPGMSCKGKY